jgi:hypothetical protein
MRFSPKLRKILIFSYILSLFFGTIYVYKIVNSDSLEVKEKSEKKDVVYYKPVRFTLKISSSRQKEEFNLRMENSNTILGVIDELRKDEKLTYEKTAYRYGTDLVQINNELAPEGFDWRIFANGQDVTYDISKIRIESDGIYELRLVSDKQFE